MATSAQVHQGRFASCNPYPDGLSAKTAAFVPLVGAGDRSERHDLRETANYCLVGIHESHDEPLLAERDGPLPLKEPVAQATSSSRLATIVFSIDNQPD